MPSGWSWHHLQGGPPWPSDAISIESNGISNRSNRNSQKFSNGRKIARMARILTIFGRNRSSRRNLSFQKFSNERKIIESIESIDWIGRSIDRIDRWPPYWRSFVNFWQPFACLCFFENFGGTVTSAISQSLFFIS